VIHILPAGDVGSGFRTLSESMEDRLASFIKSGRAAFGVVLRGYIGRLQPAGYEPPAPSTVEFLEQAVARITELRRGLDYLATRPDLDTTRLAFFGPSTGGAGLILAAVEDRYRAAAFVGAGLTTPNQTVIPAANPANFASHVRAPKFMLQGLYDEDSPLKTMAEPLYALFTEPKRLVTYPGGHVPAIDLQFAQIAAWLDQVMGPVKR
jgi:dienelactone hydrolase